MVRTKLANGARILAAVVIASIAAMGTARSTDGVEHLKTLLYGQPSPVASRHGPISSHAQVRSRFEELATFTTEHFWSQPANTTILDRGMITPLIERFDFDIDGIESYALAYVYHRQPSADCALLVIPGSGEHQAYATMFGQSNAGPIVAHGRAFCHVWIYIRPGNDADALAFIHTGATLNEAVLNHLLVSRGSSYHVRVAIEITAIALALSETYGSYAMAGLSQGASLAAIAATAVPPCLTVLASGFTLQERALWGANWINAGILIPGIDDLSDDVQLALDQPQTMLAYNNVGSQNGADDAFTYEYSTLSTCTDMSAANCALHSQGHTFPFPETTQHLMNHIQNCQ